MCLVSPAPLPGSSLLGSTRCPLPTAAIEWELKQGSPSILRGSQHHLAPGVLNRGKSSICKENDDDGDEEDSDDDEDDDDI